MSAAKHTPESLREFAVKHAPALSEEITRLCGQVIAKGMTGILEAACRVQVERDELLEFAEEVRRIGDARLASMAIAIIAKTTKKQREGGE